MSFSYSQESRRRGAGFSATGKRSLLGYWVPLAMTVGIAAIGVATWIWSERDDDEDDYRDNPEGPEFPPPPGDIPPDATSAEYTRTTTADTHEEARQDDGSVITRMQEALRRTPSPQQILDGASRKVAAGMAAVFGGGLASIREEGRGDFEDHSRWSEEVDSRARNASQTGGPNVTQSTSSAQMSQEKKRKTVAIVLSSVSSHEESVDMIEHASILSHLQGHVDLTTTKVFVLIYAPDFKHSASTRSSTRSSSRPTPSIESSFSNIGPEEVAGSSEFPGTDMATIEPRPADDIVTASPLFKTLYRQAQSLVDKETMIMPFNTPTGHIYILRHLSPDFVYIQESLTGEEGEVVRQMSGWVRQVVIVVGDDRGGLIDSEDESALADKGEKWWQKEGVTGIGKGIDIVDGLRTEEDWRRRVSGHD
ncbi:hypothetical protein V8E54_011785 [Elaphomyces granulatus]